MIDAVFTAFQPFERYGFNKAHATCYGLVAYQTAYLKANHTVEYMTAVLTAFRDNGEKVAAAIAECRRLGIEVRPPDILASHVEFTVEGDAIRFGLLAVRNVGEGAIESIIAAREDGGSFRSLTDLCSRIDMRLVNRKVLESLTRVGALNAFGHPARILLGLDDAMAAAQAAQRDRLTGQTSLFDVTTDDAADLERPLPDATEAPMRERLRWEKELLGLYLSEHPMGEVADQVGAYVTAYSGDLRDETLDGQRVVVGGIVTGARTVITKARATMAIVTLEDLQGSLEVVVFPRLYEQTTATWQDGAILLVAGRVDHRGEEASVLADLVAEWDVAVTRGPEVFAREVAAGERGSVRRRSSNGEDGRRGSSAGTPVGPGVAVGPGAPVGSSPARSSAAGPSMAGPSPMVAGRPPETGSNGHAAPGVGSRSGIRIVSPLRPEAWPPGAGPLGELPSGLPAATADVASAAMAAVPLPRIAPATPVPSYAEPPGSELASPDLDDEPPLPDEYRTRTTDAAAAPTRPTDAGPGRILHVRFSTAAGQDRLVAAMETFRAVIRDRPGSTRVVLHVPAGGMTPLPMELRSGVAYDADLLAEVGRRLGSGLVELQLA